MHTLRWFVYFWWYLLTHIRTLKRGLNALRSGDFKTADDIAYRHVPEWCQKLIELNNVEIIITGKENIPDVPCIFVANHRGLWDIPLMLTSFGKPIPLIAKIESKKIPLIRSWMELLHCLFLDRSNPRQGMQIITEASELVKQGYSVGIFPEGTRWKGSEGEVGTFLGGAFRIAAKSGAPVVPVAIFNTRALLEGDGHFTMKPGKVAVHILPAIDVQTLDRAAQKELPARLEQMIRDELAKGM